MENHFEPFVGMKVYYVYKVWATVKERKLHVYHTSFIWWYMVHVATILTSRVPKYSKPNRWCMAEWFFLIIAGYKYRILRRKGKFRMEVSCITCLYILRILLLASFQTGIECHQSFLFCHMLFRGLWVMLIPILCKCTWLFIREIE